MDLSKTNCALTGGALSGLRTMISRGPYKWWSRDRSSSPELLKIRTMDSVSQFFQNYSSMQQTIVSISHRPSYWCPWTFSATALFFRWGGQETTMHLLWCPRSGHRPVTPSRLCSGHPEPRISSQMSRAHFQGQCGPLPEGTDIAVLGRMSGLKDGQQMTIRWESICNWDMRVEGIHDHPEKERSHSQYGPLGPAASHTREASAHPEELPRTTIPHTAPCPALNPQTFNLLKYALSPPNVSF